MASWTRIRQHDVEEEVIPQNENVRLGKAIGVGEGIFLGGQLSFARIFSIPGLDPEILVGGGEDESNGGLESSRKIWNLWCPQMNSEAIF